MKRKVALFTAAAMLACMLPLTGCNSGKYDFTEVLSDFDDVEVSDRKSVV